MSTGNGGAAIGLANSNKIVPIGSPPLVPDTVEPTAGVNYEGVNLKGNWSYNFLGEDAAFTVPSTNVGKNCVWVTSGAAPIVVSADGSMAVTGAGVATAAVGGAFKSLQIPTTTIPANAWFWVES
jgi:hypothetical protein